MSNSLSREIKGIEITDELIVQNKRYQKLAVIYDKYEELIEAIRITEGLASYQSDAQIKALVKMQGVVEKEMSLIYEGTQKGIYLNRMMKSAMYLKALSRK